MPAIARSLRFALPMLLALLLGACATRPARTPVEALPPSAEGLAAQDAREAALAARPDWSFRGRMAVSQAGEGASARIEWTQRGEDLDIRISAPVTRQSWRLRRSGGLATLEGLAGGPRQGSDASALLREATGWPLPVDALSAWVRGVRAGGASGPAELELDAQGRPAVLRQAGWRIEYRAWNAGSPALPTRVDGRAGEAGVRLAVEAWSAP